MTLPVVAVVMLAVYVYLSGLLLLPDLEEGLSASEMKSLPLVSTVAKTGYYFILPIVVLLWCVLVNRLSPGLSAFYACIVMMFVTRHTASSETFSQQARDTKTGMMAGMSLNAGSPMVPAT